MAVTFTPRSVTAHEDDVLSVVTYNVEVRAPDHGLMTSASGIPADPSGDTVIPLGDGGCIQAVGADLVGREVVIWVQQVGQTGAMSEFVQANPSVTVRELPDGPESLVVNL